MYTVYLSGLGRYRFQNIKSDALVKGIDGLNKVSLQVKLRGNKFNINVYILP